MPLVKINDECALDPSRVVAVEKHGPFTRGCGIHDDDLRGWVKVITDRAEYQVWPTEGQTVDQQFEQVLAVINGEDDPHDLNNQIVEIEPHYTPNLAPGDIVRVDSASMRPGR